MGTIPTQARLPTQPDTSFARALVRALAEHQREVATQVNNQATGKLAAFASATGTAPASTTAAPGDFAPNNNPIAFGSPGSRYIVLGWRFVEGAWLEVTELVD